MKVKFENLTVEDTGNVLKVKASPSETIFIGKSQVDGLIKLFQKIQQKDELLQQLANAVVVHDRLKGRTDEFEWSKKITKLTKELTLMDVKIPHREVLLSRGKLILT